MKQKNIVATLYFKDGHAVYSPLLDDPRAKGALPLWTPRLSVQWLSILLLHNGAPYPNRKDQARKSTQNKGEFPCLVHCL